MKIKSLFFPFEDWNIGFIQKPLSHILTSTPIAPQWMQHKYLDRLFADPFLLHVTDTHIEVLVEELIFREFKGHLSRLIIDKTTFKLLDRQDILKLDTHLSYPFIIEHDGLTYVLPENHVSGQTAIYRYNHQHVTLEYVKNLIDIPLVDAVIFEYQGCFYLLGIDATAEKGHEWNLLLFYADSLLGDYHPHPLNPLMNGKKGIRGGGNIFFYENVLYRATQNCEHSYGAELIIKKITELSRMTYQEIPCSTLTPNTLYPDGTHHVDFKNGLFVFDGLRKTVNPMRRITLKTKHILQQINI